MSAANDDAINVHGTHLRILEKLAYKQLKVGFMHPQTFGFDAFFEGDKIEFIRAKTLLPYATNEVVKAEKLNEKELVLTLSDTIAADIHENDAIENATWTPNVSIINNTIKHIPTRGILVTTRGKVKIENNILLKTSLSGIFINNDASGWFESGYVKDVTIAQNTFLECSEPVIRIHPENTEKIGGDGVHKNISITNNYFKLKDDFLLSAKSTEGILFRENTIKTNKNIAINDLLTFDDCSDISIVNNTIVPE